MAVVESREWYFASYAPEDVPTSDHLKLRTVTFSLDLIPERHVVLETLFIYIEPAGLLAEKTGYTVLSSTLMRFSSYHIF